MIIKKKNFKLTPGFSGKDWPFSVVEVSIIAMKLDQKNICYGIAPPDSPELFALSGVLEGHGFRALNESGIWMVDLIKHGDPKERKLTPYKSLSPFFRFLEFKKVGLG